MSTAKKTQPPPYVVPVEGQAGEVKVYHVHTPWDAPGIKQQPAQTVIQTESPPPTFAERSSNPGFESGMMTCTNCKQEVRTNVTYKAGTYAWLMCLLFICLGLVLCCCLIPFFVKRFKDAYHTCPKCNRVLHIEKRQCCK